MDTPEAPSNLSLRQLRAFLLVTEEGNMTRAAARMHLTLSALSMLIRTLEEALGMRLFARTTRRVELTQAGLQFVPAVQQMFASLESGVKDLQAHQRLQSESVVLATSPLLAASLIPHVIAQCRQQRPRMRVTLIDVPVEQVAVSVREGRADMGICTASQEHADLVQRVLHEDALMLACHKDHPLAAGKDVRWVDLHGQPLILQNPGTGLRKLVDLALSGVASDFHASFEVANIQTALGLVAAGLGVSVLPAYSLSRSNQRDVVGVPLVDPVVNREIVAICTRTRPFSAAAEFLISHFRGS